MHIRIKFVARGAAILALALAGAFLLIKETPPAATAAGCSGSPAGPFNLQAYEAADWRNKYGRALELAGFNQLLPEVSGFGLPRIETGPRSAGSSTTANPYEPPNLLKAVAWIESAWQMADSSVPLGGIGPPLLSSSCAYGVMQVLSGMENSGAPPTLEQAAIGSHYGFNIARGARILVDKWNYAPQFIPQVGNRAPNLVESWYYALWAYNGFSFKNHPLNPAYNPQRGVYRCDGSQPYNSFPYQELVLGCLANPPTVGGTRLWQPVAVTLPNLSQPAFSLAAWNACSVNHDCAGMDFAAPTPTHSDPTVASVGRDAVIGSPNLKVSTGQINLMAVPPVVSSSGSVGIVNSGTGPLSWRITSSASWLKASATQGVALGTDLGSKASSVSVRANAQGLAPGKYTATLTVESLWRTGSPARVTVTLFNYPDGTLLRRSDGAVFVINGGLRRGIPNPATLYAYGYQWSNVLTIPDSVLNSLPAGRPLPSVLADGNLLKGSGSVYVMRAGAKRAVSSSAMASCGYGSDAVYSVPDSVLNPLPTGGAISGPPCPHVMPPSGSLVRGSGPYVYAVSEGLRRHIPNPASMAAYGLQWGNVDRLPDSVVNYIGAGNPLPDVLADGNLLKGSGPEVWAMEGGRKRHVTDLAALAACGYGWDAVYPASNAVLASLPTGTPIVGPPCPHVSPPDGYMARGSGPEVYVIRGGLKRHIPNPTSLSAAGLRWGNVDRLPDSIVGAIADGNPLPDVLADGNLLKGSGPEVWAMEGGRKRHVTNPAALAVCGYGWDAVYPATNAVLASLPTGAPIAGPPCPHVSPPDGNLVRGSGPEVYVMKGGLKRHVPNPATLSAVGLRWGNVDRLPDSVLASISAGDPLLNVLADGNLLKGSGPEVYATEGGTKRHVINPSVFSACGYGWDAVYFVPDSVLGALPAGNPVSEAPCPRLVPPDGALLQGSTAAIYVVLTGTRRPIEGGEAALSDCGYLEGNVNVLPDSAIAGIPEGPPPCP